jgi:P-type E1-E2 ATPase
LQIEHENTFQEIVDSLKVLARASASDKHTLVVGLQSMGKIVAATGEGINDI